MKEEVKKEHKYQKGLVRKIKAGEEFTLLNGDKIINIAGHSTTLKIIKKENTTETQMESNNEESSNK